MKKFIIICFFLFLPLIEVYGDVVQLQALWDVPSTYSQVRTYNLWVAPSPTGLFELDTTFTGGATSNGDVVVDMDPGETLYFELTAMYDDGEESGPSNVASYTYPFVTPPPPPVEKEAPRNLVVRAAL